MKKQILSFALVATMIGAIAAGCSSQQKATDSADSTKVDSAAAVAPVDSAKADSVKADTAKKDTAKKM